jgi:hypothetical protein
MKGLLVFIVLLIPVIAHATTPTVSNVSGTVATGQTLTITGTSMVDENKTNWDSFFTTHANAYSFEGSNAEADGYVLAGGSGAYTSSVKLLGNKSFHFNVVAHSPPDLVNVGDYYYYVMAQQVPDKWYRYYVRYHAANNIWFTNYAKQLYIIGSKNDYVDLYGSSGLPTRGYYWDGDPNKDFNLPAQLQNDRWYLYEVHLKSSSPKTTEIWIDNQKVLTSAPNDSDKTPYYVLFGFPNANAAPAGLNVDCWWDGLTDSTSRIYGASTVEISNSPTYHGGTYIYQEPLTLADGTITIKANIAGLGSGPLYLWVTNNRQEHVATPYNLSGSPAGDTTAPVSTASPVTGTYLADHPVTVSATDNVAVSLIQYCWGSSCTPTTTYSTALSFPNQSPGNTNILGIRATDSSYNMEATHYYTYTIASAADTTPPVIGAALPSGTLAYGTTSVTLQFSTDENATCKYNGSDVAYDSMGYTFSATGGTSHSQVITNRQPNVEYTYYARCVDASGNKNTSSREIAFTISGDAPTSNLLFSEDFESVNGEPHGWYDDTILGTLATSGCQTGNCLQWTWTSGQTKPANAGSSRVQFTPTDELYISYYVKFATGWRGSQQTYHPHTVYLLSDLDSTYAGTAVNYLDIYSEFISDVGSPYAIRPQIASQDTLNTNASLGTPPNDLTATTENRSVNYCNGVKSGQDGGTGHDCYSSGPYYYSATEWKDTAHSLSTNAWHHVEMYLKMNTISGSVGQTDGIMRKWIDDTLVIEKTNIIYRTNQHPTMKWGQLVLAPYMGDGSPITQTMYIDEFEIRDGMESSDNYPPSVPVFTAPTITSSLSIGISDYTATDDIGVTGYMVTESATPPVAGDSGWLGSAPSTYVVTSCGIHSLYAWAKDATGNVSPALSPRNVVVDIPQRVGFSIR